MDLARGLLKICAALLALQLVAGMANADVNPHSLFSDGVVLQRDTSVPIWGLAEDGEKISVEFRENSVSVLAKGGKWTARIPSGRAGGPFELRLRGKNEVVIRNVLVGEVWLCSGQSNMEFGLKGSEGGAEAIAKSANPDIRLFHVPRKAADVPQAEIGAVWQECGPGTVGKFSAVGYYFGRDLQKSLGVPVGLIESSVGGTMAEAWISREALEARPSALAKFIMDMPVSSPEARAEYEAKLAGYKKSAKPGDQAPEMPKRYKPDYIGRPTALFNGMINPLIPFCIKGAIWYQGEGNAYYGQFSSEYGATQAALIDDWRARWGLDDFPFLFVQLASHQPRPEADWVTLREQQTKTLALPKTAMAVAIDVGLKDDVHPKKKEPVGERLALAARAVAYGEDIPYRGPTFKSLKIEGDEARVEFEHADKGLVARDGELKGFEIAGADRRFVPAAARIEANCVLARAAGVQRPVAVRYAWSGFPECNLFNGAGLPAPPFRTDDWEPPPMVEPSAGRAAR